MPTLRLVTCANACSPIGEQPHSCRALLIVMMGPSTMVADMASSGWREEKRRMLPMQEFRFVRVGLSTPSRRQHYAHRGDDMIAFRETW